MGFFGFLTNVYMMIVFVRIILTWFRGMGTSSLEAALGKITDPYLDWFKRFPALRTDVMDLSPVVALCALSLVNRIFSSLAVYGIITLGIILALILQSAWGIISFFIGLFIIVLILRLIAHLGSRNIRTRFWAIIDSVSQPLLYRVNRAIFRDRIGNLVTGIVVSIVGLGLCYLVLGVIVSILSGVLVRLPV